MTKNAFDPFDIVSSLVGAALIGFPVIYWVVRLAGFKNRSQFFWAILAGFASIPFISFIGCSYFCHLDTPTISPFARR